MRNSMVTILARSLFFAANTEATTTAVAGTTETAVPAVTNVPEGKKGKIGSDDINLLNAAKAKLELIETVLAEKAKIIVPADHNSADYLKLVADMSTFAKENGENTAAVNLSSAKLWPVMESLNPMTLNEKTGKIDIAKFLKTTWETMTPDVKLYLPLEPDKAYSWNEARKRNNSAAMAIENVRNYIRNNGSRLYPALFPKENAEAEAARKKAEETLKPYVVASQAVVKVLELKYLPATNYVAVDENGVALPGEKPMSLAMILRAFKTDFIDTHLPKVDGEKEKAEKASAEQLAEELEAQKAEIAQLKLEKEEMAKEKAALEKASKDAAFAAKIADKSAVAVPAKHK